MRSLALSAAARNRPPYCIRGVAPTIAIERGLSILWIDAICGSVQNSITPPEKNVVPIGSANSGRQAHALRTGMPLADIPSALAEAERLRQSLLADAGRGDLLETITTGSSSVAHVYSWLWAGLLTNFENRLLGRTVSVDWIGVALALVGRHRLTAISRPVQLFETLCRSRRSSFDSRWPAVTPCTHLEANSS